MQKKQKNNLIAPKPSAAKKYLAHLLSSMLWSFIFSVILSTIFFPASANATIPKLINFQGKLTAVSGGTNVANGNYSFQFKIYDALTAGTLLWTETFDGSSGPCPQLAVTNGIFNAKLGACNPLTIDFTGGSLYLSVNFAPTGSSGTSAYDGEMSPRKQLMAAAFAFNANNLVGDGRVGIAYAPSTTTSPAASIAYTPSVSSTNNALLVTSGANVTGAALNIVQSGTGGSLLIGSVALGGATQTYVGANPASFTGNFLDFQVGSSSKFSVTNAGAVAAASALTLSGTGANELALTGAPLASATSSLVQLGGVLAGGNANGTYFGANPASFTGDFINTEVGGTSVFDVSATGTTIHKTSTNSTTAFQVQNSLGAPIFLVDTTTINIISNPGFEVNITGWAADGAGVTPTRVTTNKYHGQASLQIVTSATANTGVKDATFNSALTTTTQYTLSFYAQASGSNFATLAAGRADDGATKTACALNSTSIVTGGWQRYNCTFTTGTVSGSPFIYINQTDATARTFFIDAVQLQTGASVTPYQIGNIQVRGVINAPASFQSTTNSTTAFQIQDSAGTANLFVADTLNSRIGIGAASPAAKLDLQTTQTTGTIFSLSTAASLSLTGALTGIADTLTNFGGATGFSVTGQSVALPADTNINTATKTGLQITSGAITQNTAAATGLFVGADITVPAAVLTTGTALNLHGLRVTGGAITQTAGALAENGINIDNSGSTITTGGTLTGLQILPPTNLPAVGTSRSIFLGTSASTVANAGNTASIQVGNVTAAANQNFTTLNIANAGTGFFDLELVRGFVNNQWMNTFQDDFIGKQLDVTNKWNQAAAGTGATCSSTFTVANVNGVVRQTTGTAAAAGCTLTTQATLSNGMFRGQDNPIFETSVKVGSVTSNGIRAFYGFATSAPTSDANVGVHAFILKRAADTVWQCSVASGATETIQAITGATISTTAFQRLRVQIGDSGAAATQVTCSVDGGGVSNVQTVVTTNLPVRTTMMDLVLRTESGSLAAAVNNDIDYVRAWQDDPPLQVDTAVNTSDTVVTNGLAVNDQDSKAVLADFISRKDSLMQNNNLTRMDKLAVGLEIITPTITAQGLSIDSINALTDLINLNSDVQFFGRPYFNSDTAGFAKIQQGANQVDITFDKEYLEPPIVNASLNSVFQQVQQLFGANLQYFVIDNSTKGFSIILNQTAPQDITFSWTALAVKGAKTVISIGGSALPAQPPVPQVIQLPPVLAPVVPSTLPAPDPNSTPLDNSNSADSSAASSAAPQ